MELDGSTAQMREAVHRTTVAPKLLLANWSLPNVLLEIHQMWKTFLGLAQSSIFGNAHFSESTIPNEA